VEVAVSWKAAEIILPVESTSTEIFAVSDDGLSQNLTVGHDAPLGAEQTALITFESEFAAD